MSVPFGSPQVAPFGLPAVGGKPVVAAFDGGRITSDGGVLLLAPVERQLGIADTLAQLIADPRNPAYVTHSISDILRARILAIACGYEDADDLDVLRTDPAFKVACGRLPDSGDDLCSQPTVSRWENAPTLREVVRMTYAMIDTYCRSYARPPAAVTLDIDDTCDVAHGNQQLALFHAHYDERCFLPIHVYDAANARPVVVLFRPGKTPSGVEIRAHVRRMVRRIRTHWPDTRITLRGDTHYGRHEVMAWCENNGLRYIFGLSGNAVLDQMAEPLADEVRVRRAEAQAELMALRRAEPPVDAARLRQTEARAAAVRRHTEIRYGAVSWKCERRVAARIEATPKGLDIRYVVTNLARGSAEWLYETMYCARGQMENFIKLHKTQLRSDRTSCRSPLANQVRLVLHTAAYWLLLLVRDHIPKAQPLAVAEFKTLQMRLIKIGARIIETGKRVRVAFAAACPSAELFSGLVCSFHPAGP
ncbi:MAG TPA: IS1380 family transposase [Candidatus Acidoferrum sp.]|nr:IS1380 family transposase [Candidatus Acidoferrum sp.]